MSMHHLKPASVLALCFLFTSCGSLANLAQDKQAPEQSTRTGDLYSEEITRLNNVILRQPTSNQAKKAHLRLAELYLLHDNYRRNYPKAHEHMQAYVRLEKGIPDINIHNWLAVLNEIDMLAKALDDRNLQIQKLHQQLELAEKERGVLKRDNRNLKDTEIELKEKNSSLEASNQELRQTIEMLKRLDQRLEEKRKNLTN